MSHSKWLDRAVTLTLSPAGSGAKYEGKAFDGAYSLWTKRDEALLTLPGKGDVTCKMEEIG